MHFLLDDKGLLRNEGFQPFGSLPTANDNAMNSGFTGNSVKFLLLNKIKKVVDNGLLCAWETSAFSDLKISFSLPFIYQIFGSVFHMVRTRCCARRYFLRAQKPFFFREMNHEHSG